jgi:hypothetical protein
MWWLLITLVAFCFAGSLVLGIVAFRRSYSVSEPVKEASRLEQQAEIIQERSNATRGMFSSMWQMGPTKSRVELDQTLGDELVSKATLHKATALIMETQDYVKQTPVRLERIVETESLSHKRQIVAYENEITVVKNATEHGLSVQNEGMRQLVDIELDRKEKTDAIEVQTERVKSEVRLDEYKGIKEVDKDVYLFEKEIDAKGAIIARVAPAYEMKNLTKQLETDLGDLEYWMALPKSYQQKEMVRQLKKNIKLLKEAIYAKGQGLIQGNSRKELRGLEEGQ